MSIENGAGSAHVPSDTPAVTAKATSTFSAANGDLTFQTLHVTLEHGSEYLTKVDLGRLSACSKTVDKITEQSSGAWKRIFQDAATAGAVCKPEYLPTWLHQNHKKMTWDGEPGLLECFAKPTPQVIALVGYKRAAGCLLSKTCLHCGIRMAANANPVTMMRICKQCSDADPALWIIAKTKAKEAFLLSEKDFNSLPDASIPWSGFASTKQGEKAKQNSMIYLMSHVMQASYAKYGGADGLAAEFEKRKAAAASRYQQKLHTDKPQKKRPKIEQVSSRPANHLSTLRYFCGLYVPIPTVTNARYGSVKMTHSATCNKCSARGTVQDIVMHERLQHNMHANANLGDVVPESCLPLPGAFLSIPAKMCPPQELVQLLTNADIQHEAASKQNIGWDGQSEEIKIYNTKFVFGDCTLVVDTDKYIGSYFDMNSLFICYQTAPSTLPVRLLSLEHCPETDNPFNEANEMHFEKLLVALGLQETSSAQLVASLIARALGPDEFLDSFCEDDPSETKYPIIHATQALLEACRESDEK